MLLIGDFFIANVDVKEKVKGIKNLLYRRIYVRNGFIRTLFDCHDNTSDAHDGPLNSTYSLFLRTKVFHF